MAKNVDFNFEDFTVSAIKAIDEIRSNGINGTNSPIESRINAFYRALGLPAIRSKNSILDSFNSGNLFEQTAFASNATDQNILLNKLVAREHDFIKPLTEKEIESFTSNNLLRLKENLGAEGTTKKRLRGVMLPMVVNGDIPVYPQSKRVAGAFKSEEDLTVSKNKYKRPLIEVIISMRLKSQGVQNSQTQSNVNTDLTGQGILDFKNVGDSIGNILELSIYNIDDTIVKAISETIDAKKKLGNSKEIVPSIANIAEQKPIVREVATPTKIGPIELQKIAQQEKDNIKRAALTILEYDDTFTSDTANKRNLKESILGSILLDVINPQAENAEREADDTEKKEDKEVQRLINAYRALDLSFGQFSGISGADIIIIISSMFKVELNFLIGLLNSEAKDRLKKLNPGIDSLLTAGLSESIEALQNKVTDLYNDISDGISQPKHKNKRKNQNNARKK